MNEVVFTSEEISLLISMVSRIDEEDYSSDKAKAAIYKCRDMVKSSETERVVFRMLP